MAIQKKLHTIIIGAGTTGLLIAQGLKKAGLSYSIYEYESSTTYQTRPREWGMTLHWGNHHIEKCLPPQLAARMIETYADPTISPDSITGLPIYNGKTGELLLDMTADRPIRVSRKKLRNLFSEGLDVQYGKEFVGIKEEGDRVKVSFKDGTEVVGDVVVGCDGAKSRVREVICGKEAAALTEAPNEMFNFTVQFEAEQAKFVRSKHPMFALAIHPDHGSNYWLSIQDAPDPEKPETWTFQVMLGWINDPLPESENTYEGRLAYFRRKGEGYCEPWKSVAKWIKDDTKIPFDKGTYWGNAALWDNRKGKMTICGDAAHPMTPHRGQGLNNALHDASNFVSAIEQVASGAKSLAEAVSEYDKEVFERGTAEMKVSLQQTLFIHDWPKLADSPMVKMGMHQAKKEA